MKRCPKCSGIYSDEIIDCPNCKIKLVDKGAYYRQSKKHNQTGYDIMPKDDTLPDNPSRIKSQSKNMQQSQVTCPKCNSTQIQMVARKWSLLTGFFTNKVDRVCVNCKHKF